MTTSPASSADGELDERVAHNLSALLARVEAAGRAPREIRVVAVTKTFPVAYVEAAARCGLAHVGENYARELADKRAATSVALCWHNLGALQTNKIALLSRTADLLAGVSRAVELEVLGRQPRRPPVYLEVDYTGEPQRSGAPESRLESLLEAAGDHGVEVRGLMTVAPPEPVRARAAFAALSRAADRLGLAERSMGMTDDLELALAAGSTEIRVGRALFGPRPRV
jgi:uncharacterized pyridoxal phosphate-containing UPF0001 family protein